MEISKRLTAVAEFVKYRTIADIGTDHGYIPCFLALNKKIDSAFACDVNEGPLEKAKENIALNGLENVIKPRLGSGLSALGDDTAETIVIAGMGGLLICNILNDEKEKLKNVKQLVLQPQRDTDSVRKLLHSLGFVIEDEEMLIDNGKYYTIISAVHGSEKYENETDYLYGRKLMEKKSPVLKEYLEKMKSKYEKILSKTAEKSETDESIEKMKVQCRMAEEVLEKL